MIIFKEIRALQQHLSIQQQKGKSIGFVPTMGALHQGHLSLIQNSRSHSDITVCSIFINPTQFNDPKDFEKYPITIEKDIHLLIKEEADILFLPSVEEMYPSGLNATRHYELGYLETILEGAYRPGHFQGVCQVVHRLLDIVRPNKLFLGQKDYQQCMVLKKLVQVLSLPIKVIVVEIMREENGLAMSSRNLRLSESQKQQATAIFQSLAFIKQNIRNKTIGELQEQATATLLNNGFDKVDYIAIAEADSLQPLDSDSTWDGKISIVALAAAFIGDIRLIDNMILT